MASLATASRLTARLAGQRWVRPSRGFRTTARNAVAQNFTMPALSPTMTEGSIAAWRVKEGERFAAGDVLLEIETDKASMDVEAQEDGQVFKILQADGTKGIPVGARIGVLAEAGDDLSSLQVPPDVQAAPAADKAPASASASTPTPTPTPAAAPAASSPSPASASGPRPPQKYPLLPSVQHLIKERGLDTATVVSQATPTGPGGRLLKGDVLAFLGQVPASVPVDLASRIEALSHLDLSNIRLRAPVEKKPAEKKPAEKKPAAEQKAPAPVPNTTVTLPVSLSAVVDVQEKIQQSLGVFMPVSTFVARATEVANDALPRAGPAPAPTATQLFDEIVGTAPKASSPSARVSAGHYQPQVSALPPSVLAAAKAKKAPASDVIDILAGNSKAAARPARPAAPRQLPAVSTGQNFFSLSVPAAEAKRAQVFLERLKVVLENEPGRLVL